MLGLPISGRTAHKTVAKFNWTDSVMGKHSAYGFVSHKQTSPFAKPISIWSMKSCKQTHQEVWTCMNNIQQRPPASI